MKRLLAALSGILTFAILAAPAHAQSVVVGSASGNGIQTWPSAGTQVTISDTGYSPNPLTIQVGGVVTFVNSGSNVHTASTVTGTSPTFDTGGLAPGQSTSFQFTVPGTFPYLSNTEGDRVINNNNGQVNTTYKLNGTIIVQTGPVASTAPAPAAGPPPGPCQFILGFKALHDIDAADTGDCIDNQAFAPNGDAQQHTTKGLMAWRKADNWTAFTNGYQTWINGPTGLVNRLNTGPLFPWENPTPPAAPAPPAPPAAPAATPTPTSGYEFQSKQVTDPPQDCNSDSTRSSIPCVSVAANGGSQFIKGRVMDKNGSHLLFQFVTAIVSGGASYTQTVQTQGDGTFTFFIGNPPPGVQSTFPNSCQNTPVQYQIFVTTPGGAQDSDTYTVKYDGNCNSDGEFHFDFVKVR